MFLVTQKTPQDFPETQDLYTVGTIGTILQMLKLPDGTVKVLVEGNYRAKALSYQNNEDFLIAETETINEILHNNEEIEALCRTVVTEFEQ